MKITIDVPMNELEIVGLEIKVSHDSDEFMGERCVRRCYEVSWHGVVYEGFEVEPDSYDHAELEAFLIEESC